MLLWIDGFEGYGSSIGGAPAPTGIIDRKYPTFSGTQFFDIEAGRYGDYCLEVTDYLYYIQTPHLTTDDTMIVGVAFWTNLIPAALREFLWLYEGINRGINLRLNSDGTIAIYNNTTLIDTSLNQLSASTWYYMELKVVTHDSAGTYELRVNGADWASGTGVDTQPASNAYHTALRLGAVFGGQSRYDDLYILDSTGSANNAFKGNRQVLAYRPDGNGDTNDWTPLSGNNYEMVDEVQEDADTSYNETNTPNDIDLYDVEDATGLTTIDGLMVTTDIRVTSGSIDMKTLIKSASTTEEDAAETITDTSYATKVYVSEQDPNTATAWTQSGLNAAQFGIKAE